MRTDRVRVLEREPELCREVDSVGLRLESANDIQSLVTQKKIILYSLEKGKWLDPSDQVVASQQFQNEDPCAGLCDLVDRQFRAAR